MWAGGGGGGGLATAADGAEESLEEAVRAHRAALEDDAAGTPRRPPPAPRLRPAAGGAAGAPRHGRHHVSTARMPCVTGRGRPPEAATAVLALLPAVRRASAPQLAALLAHPTLDAAGPPEAATAVLALLPAVRRASAPQLAALLAHPDTGRGRPPEAATAVLALLPAVRRASAPQLAALLAHPDTGDIMEGLARVLGLSGAAGAHAAARDAFQLASGAPPRPAPAQQYLAALALAPHAEPAVLRGALALAGGAGPLAPHALLAVAAAARRHGNALQTDVKDYVLKSLAKCKDESCRETRLLALGQLRRGDVGALLLDAAERGGRAGLAALAALEAGPRAQRRAARRRLAALALGLAPGPGPAALELRAAALALLLREGPAAAAAPLTAACAAPARTLLASDPPPPRDLLPALDPRPRDWCKRAYDGTSSVVSRALGALRLHSSQLAERGVLRRGVVDLRLAGRPLLTVSPLVPALVRRHRWTRVYSMTPRFEAEKLALDAGPHRRGDQATRRPGDPASRPRNDSAPPLSKNVRVAGGDLGARAGVAGAERARAAPAAREPEDEPGAAPAPAPEPEDASAGIALTVAGVRRPDLVLFESQTELLGHVWAGTGSTATGVLRALVPRAAVAARALSAGLLVHSSAETVLALKLDAQAVVSLWGRSARGGLALRGAGAARRALRVRTAWGRLLAHAHAHAAPPPALLLDAALDFYDAPQLCVHAALPDHGYTHNVTLESEQGARAWRVRRHRVSSVTTAGRTLALGAANDAACAALAQRDRD
ncbi:hypothetical protein MSG28_012911 [Choristoneura fumiferana]|uniref:Uncharacterized protein n=1 Tax=Choristoneura fumiferana TaxID=7141 RepID=A0ACC0KR89_CHOFU|nr:hypothetical protein MSG28_012911 [Choristoneura fumiferana]